MALTGLSALAGRCASMRLGRVHYTLSSRRLQHALLITVNTLVAVREE
jgi:hypothetical protein